MGGRERSERRSCVWVGGMECIRGAVLPSGAEAARRRPGEAVAKGQRRGAEGCNITLIMSMRSCARTATASNCAISAVIPPMTMPKMTEPTSMMIIE